MSMKVKILEAFNGDCILINFDQNNILIDGGIGRTYSRKLKNEINRVLERGEYIDLLIVTHIDDDHIGGILKLFEDNEIDKSFIKKVWFNSEILMAKHFENLDIDPQEIIIENNDSNKMSVRQGYTLEKHLKDLNCWEQSLVMFGNSLMNYNLAESEITVLTPRQASIEKLRKKWEREKPDTNKMSSCKEDYCYSIEELMTKDFIEDNSITNKSSISFVFKHEEKQVLFLGDSHPSDVEKSLKELGYSKDKKLKVECVKLSHHGSKGNTSASLLELIDCKNYIVSTDGSKHCLPNKESLARVVNQTSDNLNFYFNYPIYQNIFTKEELQKYKINCKSLNELEV
ncbi:competence protein ComEC [Priestia megaterium]|uniref:ComEC/Rec2 family competence protein n=1 Tax=Priestia megaterium TaxID=1404 RepID=UPI0039E0BB85